MDAPLAQKVAQSEQAAERASLSGPEVGSALRLAPAQERLVRSAPAQELLVRSAPAQERLVRSAPAQELLARSDLDRQAAGGSALAVL